MMYTKGVNDRHKWYKTKNAGITITFTSET